MRHPHQARFVCLLLLVAACAHWEAQTRSISEIVSAQPEQLLVTRHDSSTVILIDPVVVDSSLVGSLRTPRGRVNRDTTVHVPFSDIARAATWDTGSSGLFWAALGGVLGLMLTTIIVCFTGRCES
jgi:hypothetical protein